MKNAIIAVLIVLVLGLGGWAFYDKIMPVNSTDSSAAGTKDTAADSGQASPQPSTASVLDLSGRGLTKVGPDIYTKTATTQLILSNNNLRTLPTEMGKMTKLEVLKLDHNSLDGSLIGEVRLMPLKVLDVSNNAMTGMPAEIGQLNKLQSLDFSNNRLTGLPNELSNLKNNLKDFNLSGNPLDQGTVDKLKAALPNTNIIF